MRHFIKFACLLQLVSICVSLQTRVRFHSNYTSISHVLYQSNICSVTLQGIGLASTNISIADDSILCYSTIPLPRYTFSEPVLDLSRIPPLESDLDFLFNKLLPLLIHLVDLYSSKIALFLNLEVFESQSSFIDLIEPFVSRVISPSFSYFSLSNLVLPRSLPEFDSISLDFDANSLFRWKDAMKIKLRIPCKCDSPPKIVFLNYDSLNYSISTPVLNSRWSSSMGYLSRQYSFSFRVIDSLLLNVVEQVRLFFGTSILFYVDRSQEFDSLAKLLIEPAVIVRICPFDCSSVPIFPSAIKLIDYHVPCPDLVRNGKMLSIPMCTNPKKQYKPKDILSVRLDLSTIEELIIKSLNELRNL
ncbi:hypothetical protein GEMRC1_002627 [Eukaryota sp. GEM-RC1]